LNVTGNLTDPPKLNITSTSNITITGPTYKYTWVGGANGHQWSNDPSFQQGFKAAEGNNQALFTSDPGDGWEVHSHDDVSTCYGKFYSGHKLILIADPVTCIKGYVQGFQYWCSTNTKWCAIIAQDGNIPSTIMSNKNGSPAGSGCEQD
jgi:hypothetical protein